VEDDVDAPLGRHSLAVAHAGAKQALDAVDPVGRERRQVEPRPRDALAVGEHRDRRLDHGDRIAMRDRDGRVGKRVDERAQLLEVLRRLEHPAVRAAQPLERLQRRLEVRVVRPLVERQVVIAPARRAAQPLEPVRREVQVLDLDLLVHVLRRHVVHRLQERHPRGGLLVLDEAPHVPRIAAVAARPFAGDRNGLEALPVRQRAQARSRRRSGSRGASCPSAAGPRR
jgi:hypothetical protein